MPETRNALFYPFVHRMRDDRGDHFIVSVRVPPTYGAPFVALTDSTDSWNEANAWLRRIRRIAFQALVERHVIDRDAVMRELRLAGLAAPLPSPPTVTAATSGMPKRTKGALG